MAEAHQLSAGAGRRVLVCGDFANATQPLAAQCADALEDFGFSVERVDTEIHRRKLPEAGKRWMKSLAKLAGRKQQLAERFDRMERHERNERVRQAFRARRPDLALVIRGNDVDAGLLAEMRGAGVVTACWWIKDVQRLANMRSELAHYDLYYCIHRDQSVEGIRHLPAYALDTRRFYPPAERRYSRDVGFVGIWNGKRQTHLARLADLDLGIAGPGWRTRNLLTDRRLLSHVVAGRLHGDALVRFYHSARIIVNINQWAALEASGTTLRVADVPACGAFLLTEYSRELQELFELGREVETFDSAADLEGKVRFYLAHDGAREKIARAGYERALRLPSHADRMRAIAEDAGILGRRAGPR